MSQAASKLLQQASNGLVYTSETDAPLEAFAWTGGNDPITSEKFRELSKTDPSKRIKEVSINDFFATQTERYDGQSEDEEKTVERFKDLQKLITTQLADVKVFRVGDVDVSYYVVGKTKGGDWAGVWTRAVET